MIWDNNNARMMGQSVSQSVNIVTSVCDEGEGYVICVCVCVCRGGGTVPGV